MASSFLTAPKPILFKTNAPSLHNSNQRPLLGLRRNSLRVNAISKIWEPTKVVPQADRVLVRLEELPEKSAGGVLLPKAAVKFERYLNMLQILSVGADVGEVEAGKKVLFSDINAYEVDLGTDAKHCFCKSGDLLAMKHGCVSRFGCGCGSR
ncbi:10 kDa chaperonin 1, chloroplastic-like [Castanea sativa]|uniref:10 kDa chaperonin 1, chloroplastic-like n=1 Tax=Castanea sativa TaxID=21020 RepID=UPI003F653AA5